MAKKSITSSAYDVHPGVAMVQKWTTELPKKTGRTLEEWADLVRAQKFENVAAGSKWLKKQYELGTMTAEQICEYAIGQQTWDGNPEVYLKAAVQYVDNMFAARKAHLRPIAEAVMQFARTLGTDVKICPCKTIIPLYRQRVFAQLQPSTQTRLDLALCLDELPFEGILKKNPRAKGNDKLRHLIALSEPTDFDGGARNWLKKAYETVGPDK